MTIEPLSPVVAVEEASCQLRCFNPGRKEGHTEALTGLFLAGSGGGKCIVIIKAFLLLLFLFLLLLHLL